VRYLEIEVKSEQQAVAAQVCSGDWGCTSLSNPGVLVVERETRAAGHERVIAVAEDVIVDVAEIGWVGRKCLLRHAYPLGALENRELRAVYVVGFDKRAVPGGISGSSGKNARRIVLRGGVASAGDDIAIAGPKPGAV